MKRILLVDDDTAILRLLATSLSDYDLTFAHDGGQAWMLAQRDGKPDLLVTDYMMPSLFGDELIASLRRLWPDLKVLVLTGHCAILEGENQAWWRTEAHLAKPFQLREVRERVAELLASRPSCMPPSLMMEFIPQQRTAP